MAARDKLAVAMVGVGDITARHEPAYRDFDGAELVCLCDRDERTLAARAQAWGVSRTTPDLAAVLQDPEIDIVEINTPHHLHRPMVEAALAAGKHVACQKPVATTVADAEAIVRAAARAPGRFRVLENFVYYPPYVKARELLRAGEIGEPLTARFKLGSSLVGSRWVPLQSELWHLLESDDGMGQAVFDDGFHKLSQAIDLFGAVDEVQGFIGRSIRYVDEPGQLVWRYRDCDVLASFDLAFSPTLYTASPYFPADERIDVIGTEGALHVTRCTGQIVDEAPLVLEKGGRRYGFSDLEADWQASFTAAIRDFPRAISEGRDAALTAERARDVLRLAFALIAAARLGATLRPDEVTDEVARQGLSAAGQRS